MFDELDRDKDLCVTRQEFYSGVGDQLQPFTTFGDFDLNEDGCFSPTELLVGIVDRRARSTVTDRLLPRLLVFEAPDEVGIE